VIRINPESSVVEQSQSHDFTLSGLPAISHTVSLELKSGLLNMHVSREHSKQSTSSSTVLDRK